MQNLPFDKPGRFFRGNIHCHSTCSDGAIAPSELVAAYQARGYDFMAITDHFVTEEYASIPVTDTRALRQDRFTTLLGAELHGPGLASGDEWHILAIGLPVDFAPWRAGETGMAIAARAAAAGAFIGIAHPAWYTLTPADALALTSAHAVEIYNEVAARINDRGESWYLAELLLAGGCRVTGFAADDAHFGQHDEAFGGWVEVRAESLDADSLLTALKAGHYYSTQGPLITCIAVDGDAMRVSCSPACSIFVTGKGYVAQSRHGCDLAEATFGLSPFQPGGYCRVTVVDAHGKRAWSNPIWIDGSSDSTA